MNKISHYITNGKGIGAVWVFLFAFLLAVFSSINFYHVLTPILPSIQNAADELLPIKIENNQVVIPENMVKTYTVPAKDQSFVLSVDTTRDLLDETTKTDGFYLTKSYVYSIIGNEIRRQPLTQNLDLPKQDYMPLLSKFVLWLSYGIAFIGPIFNFIIFLLVVAFYAFCSEIAAMLNKKSVDFPFKMRLNTVLFITVYFFSTLLNYIGLRFSLLAFFLCMIALQIISLKYLGKANTKN